MGLYLLLVKLALCQEDPVATKTENPAAEYNKEALQKLTEFRLRVGWSCYLCYQVFSIAERLMDGSVLQLLCKMAKRDYIKTNLFRFCSFTDCTTTRDPNGTSGKEWCYVEVQLLGKGGVFLRTPSSDHSDANLKNWNYCQPVIDYDFIRSKAEEAIQLEVEQIDRVRSLKDLILSVSNSW